MGTTIELDGVGGSKAFCRMCSANPIQHGRPCQLENA
jgi:hypothetical protein